MLNRLKAFVKTKPTLFDLVLRFYPSTDPVDEFFDSFSRSRPEPVRFIQIGASDGLRWDPVRKYIVRDRWKGILVEPLPNVFRDLRSNYGHLRRTDLIFVNAAITSKTRGDLSFWTYSDEFLSRLPLEDRMAYLRKSSFDRDHVTKALKDVADPETLLREIRVPAMSVNDLVRDYWTERQLDLLIIDAEGHDAVIIQSMDFGVCRPGAIFYESHNLGPQRDAVEEFLARHDFVIKSLGGDSVALSR
jgi:FkbM family methyltransferase